MRGIEGIEMAVAALPEKDYSRFHRWFFKRDWEKWDREIEQDAKAGKLDFILKEAVVAKAKGRLRAL